MSKKIKIITITLVLVASLVLSFSAGCRLGNETPPNSEMGLDVINEAWDIIFQDYVDKEKLDTSVMSGAAIKGMVEALDDPYSSYLDAQTYQLSRTSIEGKYEGIGAEVGMKDGQIMIIAPFVDSPAAKAGIRAGDIILEVEGRSALDMSVQEAVLHIRGPKGTPVKLLILHQGETAPEEIEIIRAEIKLSAVHFEMKDNIAYIRLSYFSESTNDDLLPVMESIVQEAATGIILDLRSNPGGLLLSVADVASNFIKEGIVVSVVDNQGKKESLSVEPGRVVTELPLVVMTDNYSASGSEVLAGALQDHNRATIVGTRTYGKGSVNSLHQFEDGSGLYITTARWLTPNGRLIEGEGISPDYEPELEGDDAIQWAIDYLNGNK